MIGSSVTGDDEEDGAGVIEFENAKIFWREYMTESELEEKDPERLAGLSTFKRVLKPFLDNGKIRFTGCKGELKLIYITSVKVLYTNFRPFCTLRYM